MGREMFARYMPVSPRRDLPTSGVVRLATEADLDACARLAVARDGGDASVWISRLSEHLAADDAALFVADVGDVVGFGRVAWFAPPDDAPGNAAPSGYYLLGLLVDTQWRRGGLGERLTAACLAWVWERAAECWYFANAGNRASLDLHERLGFRPVTRDFCFPGVTFEGGEGVLSRAVRR
jgi:GNAT superfamily N-acetyltransferase